MALSQADKRILELVKPEYMKRIPFFVKGHATKSTCQLIAREHPDLYAKFTEDVVSDEAKAEMTALINGIFEERMKKHDL